MTTKEESFLRYRQKVLPDQLDKARRKYHALVREARRMKMNKLLTNNELHGEEYENMTDYIIITSEQCLWCDKVKNLLDKNGKTYSALSLDDYPELFVIMKALGAKTVPQVLKVVGGFEATAGDLG